MKKRNEILFCRKVSIRYFVFTVCLFFVSMTINAQQTITGRITDVSDGYSIPNASILISNSTIGTVSDDSGKFSLNVPIKGIFEIIVSHVGYNPVFYQINTPQPNHLIDIALEVTELPEIVVTASRKYNNEDVKLFWRKILGVEQSRRIEILNANKVYYYKNDSVLKVSCKEPILIVNHEMGYKIQYVLQSFEHNYRTNESLYYGQPHFEEISPQNLNQKIRWEKKRQEVYNVSITRFLKALYNRELLNEGFLLIKRDSLINEKILPVIADDVIRVEQERVLVNIEELLLLICYSKPVTDKMIMNSYDLIKNRNVIYPVVYLKPQQITIFPDGTYAGIMKMDASLSYKSIIGISNMLPIGYDNNHLINYPTP